MSPEVFWPAHLALYVLGLVAIWRGSIVALVLVLIVAATMLWWSFDRPYDGE